MYITDHAIKAACDEGIAFLFPRLALWFGKRGGGANSRVLWGIVYAYSKDNSTLSSVWRQQKGR